MRSCSPIEWSGAGVEVGMVRGGGGVLGFLVSEFLGFKVSWFLGFKVSWFLGFKVSKFQRFKSFIYDFVQKHLLCITRIPFHVIRKIFIPYPRCSRNLKADLRGVSVPVLSKTSQNMISETVRFTNILYLK